MTHEMMERLHSAFCAELQEICSDVGNNSGRFRNDREMLNAKACIKAVAELSCLKEHAAEVTRNGMR